MLGFPQVPGAWALLLSLAEPARPESGIVARDKIEGV